MPAEITIYTVTLKEKGAKDSRTVEISGGVKSSTEASAHAQTVYPGCQVESVKPDDADESHATL